MKKISFIWILLLSLSSVFAQEREVNFNIIEQLPHQTKSFTQGLFLDETNTKFYESVGLYGKSAIQLVDLKSGKILKRTDLDSSLFGEGLAELNGKFYQLTWKAGKILVYDKDFKLIKTLIVKSENNNEGWGLTVVEGQLVMSDGSNLLYFIKDIEKANGEVTFTKVIEVKHQGRAVSFLNELEYARGKIFANIWGKNLVVIINPNNGVIESTLDLSKLAEIAKSKSRSKIDVLNGIAWDSYRDEFYFTGKLWPIVFKVKL